MGYLKKILQISCLSFLWKCLRLFSFFSRFFLVFFSFFFLIFFSFFFFFFFFPTRTPQVDPSFFFFFFLNFSFHFFFFSKVFHSFGAVGFLFNISPNSSSCLSSSSSMISPSSPTRSSRSSSIISNKSESIGEVKEGIMLRRAPSLPTRIL